MLKGLTLLIDQSIDQELINRRRRRRLYHLQIKINTLQIQDKPMKAPQKGKGEDIHVVDNPSKSVQDDLLLEPRSKNLEVHDNNCKAESIYVLNGH